MELSELICRLQRSYDREAKDRDESPKQSWKLAEREGFLRRLQSHQASSVLEIGAGTGHDSRFFQDRRLRPTCVDLSEEMVGLCRAKGLTAYRMNFLELGFPSASFDAAWAMNCLLHVPKNHLAGVLEGVRRVLKDGGLFYLGVYGGQNSEGVWDQDHHQPQRFFSFFTDEDLKAAVRPYFAIRDFHAVDYGHRIFHFQSMTLQKA